MTMDAGTEALRQQYATDDNLRLRQATHDLYSVPKINFPEWVIDRIAWRGDERVLDVGAGSGIYDAPLHDRAPECASVAVDWLAPMLAHHPGPLCVQADAQALPFAASSFDVVMANHMLYHVPDPDIAIHEFRRVMTPNGLLLTATNSVQNMPEFNALLRRAIGQLSMPNAPYAPGTLGVVEAYSLESGTRLLSRHFGAVVRYDLPQMLIFDKPEPVVSYLQTARTMREPLLPEGVLWDDVMLVLEEQVARVIRHFGELVVNKLTGVLVATDRGGFIKDYRESNGGHTAPEE